MKKIKAVFSLTVAAALLFGGYFLADHFGLFHQTSELSEPPKLADGLEDGGTGGQLEGEVPGSGNAAGTDDKPDADGADKPGDSNGGATNEPGGSDHGEAPGSDDGISRGEDGAIAVLAQPESVTALVNPFNKLPENYSPSDLVYPDVRFIFSEKVEKRMLRKEAAEALERMFAAAEKDGIYLAGVSGYRSHETQKALFDRYVKRDGYEKARTYSALPGTSEHETGLAMDVSGSDGKCAAADCFGDTKEAKWLKKNAAEHGFIIRYPDGKDDITGYQYEPWHLRYVGELAVDIAEGGLTLEEYYDAVPVSR